jgi:hypothetical protein
MKKFIRKSKAPVGQRGVGAKMSLQEPLLPAKRKPGTSCQLLELLADPEFRRAWTAFLQQTYCYENMQFYQAVEEYQARPTDERVLLARHIYANYIEDGAEYQVNLSSQERRPLTAAIVRLAETTDVPSSSCCS